MVKYYWNYFVGQNLVHKILLFSSVLILVGLSTSPALMSIGCLGFFLAFLLDYSNFHDNINKIKNFAFFSIIILYFLHFLHIFENLNPSQLGVELRVKLPFLLLPLGFVIYKPRKEDFLILCFFYIVTISIASFLTLFYYFIHFEEMNIRILESKEIPIFTKVNHIYFSVILAFAIVLCFYIYHTLKIKIYAWLGVFLFLCIHILSTRTGLLALYLAGLVSFAYYVIKNKEIKLIILGILALIIFPLTVYWLLPSFKNRIINTYEDIQRYRKKQDINHRSVSMRLVAWEMAYYAFMKSPWIGVGMENISTKINEEYEIHQVNIWKENRLNDLHNQFWEYLLGLGIIGFIIFLSWLIYPIIFHKKFFVIVFLSVLIGSMFSESLLERQTGVCFGLFWYYFIIQYNFHDL